MKTQRTISTIAIATLVVATAGNSSETRAETLQTVRGPKHYVVRYPTGGKLFTPTRTTMSDAAKRFVKRGVTQHPNGGYARVMFQAGGRAMRHLGADISWYRVKQPVYAIADGVVRLSMPPARISSKSAGVKVSRSVMDWGNAIVIEHRLSDDETILAIYAHLGDQRRVHMGDVVCAGQQIGTIGRKSASVNSGYEPHLHLGIREGSSMKQGAGLFGVSIKGKPALIRLGELGEETITVTAPEGTPDVWGIALNGQPITVRKTEDGKYPMPASILWGAIPPETPIVGYGASADGWISPLGLLRDRRASGGKARRLHPTWYEVDDPLPNVTGEKARPWNVDHWLRPLRNGAKDIDDLAGKILCLVFVQTACSGSHSHALPNIAKVAENYPNHSKVQVVVLQTPFKKNRKNARPLFQKIADRLPKWVAVGDYDEEVLPPPIVDNYSIRCTPWIVLIDGRGRVRLSGTHIRGEECIKIIDALKKEETADNDDAATP